MKKLITFIIGLTLVFSLAGCSNTRQSNSSETETLTPESSETDIAESSLVSEPESESKTTKTLVVYYSATGNTQEAANFIAAATNADVFELEPKEPYTEDELNWTDANSRVVYEHDNPDARDVELVSTNVPDWESYDTVFIGYPIWWGIAAWPVNGFIEANDFTGKTVVPFCTSSSSGLGESGNLLAELSGTGTWLEGERFSSGVTEEAVQTWVESLNR